MVDDVHVILGAGPVGTWTARALRELGAAVRVVSRSGRRSALLPADVPVAAADLSEVATAVTAVSGAAVVYQALNPPYSHWPELFPPLQRAALAAAEAVGARYVSVENLYLYGRPDGPLRADSPQRPETRKGRLRQAMARDVLDAHARGAVAAASLRSSDYYGPGVLESALGERVFGAVVAGRPAQVLGSADVTHAVAYIEDVARAAAALGTRPDAAGHAWLAPHASAPTQRELVERAAAVAGRPARVRVLGPAALRLAGLVVPQARESVELLYLFAAPFVVDASATETGLGLSATPLEEGVRRTVEWYAAQPRSGRRLGVR